MRSDALRRLVAAAAATFGAACFPPRRADEFWAAMRGDALTVPQLYMYSDADEVTAAEPLRALIAARRAERGAAMVQEWRLQGADAPPHVGILRARPAEYVERLAAFLRDAHTYDEGQAPRTGVL